MGIEFSNIFLFKMVTTVTYKDSTVVNTINFSSFDKLKVRSKLDTDRTLVYHMTSGKTMLFAFLCTYQFLCVKDGLKEY